jgi:hypothetical protein
MIKHPTFPLTSLITIPYNDNFCVVVVTGINWHHKDKRFAGFVVTNKYNKSTGLDKRHINGPL